MRLLDEKHAIILEHERRFADLLALQVLEKPKLSVWMILIPIIFVHYFYRMQKFNSGRNAFADNYLTVRKRALDGARATLQTEAPPDVHALSGIAHLPQPVQAPHVKLLDLLISHYIDLMRSEGGTIESLIRSAYKTRANYLLFVNQLNQAEKTLNSALQPHLAESLERVDDIIAAMEQHSARLRRIHVDTVFP